LENRAYPADSAILVVEAPPIAADSRPGQFVMTAPEHDREIPHPLLKRALAVYRIHPKEKAVSLLIKAVGEGTREIVDRRAGDRLEMVGPLGKGFDLGRAKGRINLLVVGGTGIASVYLLAEHLVKYGEEVHLLYGGRDAEALIGLDDFEKLEIPICVTTEDGSRGVKGFVTQALSEYLDPLPAGRLNLYTCGPNPMMKAVAEIAAARNIPCQLSMESKMACGFGACLGCSVMTTQGQKLSCKDGPVFDADSFLWEEDWELVR